MCKAFIFISSILVYASNYGMADPDIIVSTCHEIIKQEVGPHIFRSKLAVKNNILVSFKQAINNASDEHNGERKKILDATQEMLCNLKNLIFLSRTNTSFYHQLRPYISEQEGYIFNILYDVNIYRDMDYLLLYVGSATVWRNVLSQLKLYVNHKEILQFFTYCYTKRKAETFSYNAPYSEMVLSYLLNLHCNPDAPALCCNFGKQFSKFFYRSLCKEKQLLLQKIAQYIAKGILLKQQCVKLISSHEFDQVSLKGFTIIIDNNAAQNNLDFKRYLLIKK
jgi:hypothetical protein